MLRRPLTVVYALLTVYWGASVVVSTAPTVAAGESDDWHRDVFDPIDIQLSTVGGLELGQSIDLQATLTAQWHSLTDVLIEVSTPAGVIVEDSPLVRRDLALGAPEIVTFTLRPLTADDHFIVVRASAEHAIGHLGGYAQAYLAVPASGSGTFHPNSLPAEEIGMAVLVSALPWVGTLTGDLGVTPAPQLGEGPRPDPTGIEVGILGTGTVSGCYVYEQETAGSFAAQRYASYGVYDAGTGALLASGITANPNGCFTSSTVTAGSIYVGFFASNSWLKITDTSNVIWDAYTSTFSLTGSINIGTWTSPSTERWAWRPFQYENNVLSFAYGNGFPTFSQLRTFIPDSCTFYTRSDDTIHLCNNGVDDKSPDDVGHETAHFIHEKAYADTFWPSPGGAHSLCADNQNTGLSWTEGFANFFGPRANNELSGTPGANGDDLYSRPWDGSQFSRNMETSSCGVTGYDNEMNVAQSLWDLRDAANDVGGFDLSSNSMGNIDERVLSCDDSNYLDYYNSGCGWVSGGYSACNFVRTALQNRIDFNVLPTSTMTSQNGFAWVRGTIGLSATASDPDCAVGDVNFRVSTDSSCNTGDADAGTDSASPYSASYNTALQSNGASLWTCARARDSISSVYGGFDTSDSNVRVDNAAPTATLSSPAVALAPYTVSWSVSDPHSGLTGTLVLQERAQTGAIWFDVCSAPVSGSGASGGCARSPPTGAWCYRVIVSDVAGNMLVTLGSTCTVKV